MYYGQITRADSANGVGMRVSLFVSGCTNHCKGCFQPQTWDFSFGSPYTKETEDELVKELQRPFYSGITILGGEPFEPENQRELVKLIRRIRRELPTRTIWMYTGNVYEDMLPGGKRHIEVTDEILDNIDVLVDGPFVEEKKNIGLNFRGSENQRIIDRRRPEEPQSFRSRVNMFFFSPSEQTTSRMTPVSRRPPASADCRERRLSVKILALTRGSFSTSRA